MFSMWEYCQTPNLDANEMKTIFGRKSLPAIENQELCVER